MTDGRPATPPGAARNGAIAVAVVAVTVLVLLVAVWASSTGPDDSFRGDGLGRDRVTTASRSVEPTGQTGGQGRNAPGAEGEGSSVLTAAIGLLVLGMGIMLVIALSWAAGRYAILVLSERREPRRRDDSDLPPLDPVEAIAAAMIADADEQRDLLASGSPRNAVVECWHRFEVQAERAGVPREPWETSAEFTLRLLDLVEAEAASVARLAELYREARFSEHELGEEARQAGFEALAQIHRDLRSLLSRGRL